MSEHALSSYDILHSCYQRRLHRYGSLEEVLSIWHTVGKILEANLLHGRGTRIDGLGTFTYSTTGSPCFLASSDFKARAGLKQAGAPTVGAQPVSKLSLTRVASEAGLPRSLAEKTGSAVLQHLSTSVRDGARAALNFHPVVELLVASSVVKHRFTPEFLVSLGGGSGGARAAAARQGAALIPKCGFVGRPRRAPMDAWSSSRDTEWTDRTRRVSRRTLEDEVDSMPSSPRGMPASPSRSELSDRRALSLRSYPTGPSESRLRRGARRSAAVPPTPMAGRNASGVAAEARSRPDVLERIRQRLLDRGGANGIRSVARILRIMDDDGNGRLSKAEMRYGLKDMGIHLKDRDVDAVFAFFDRDGDGSISFDEFLTALRGEMNARRTRLVRRAFQVLDRTGDGEITIDDIRGVYDASQHPDVLSGRKAEAEVLTEFLIGFDGGDKDGIISLDEFIEHYRSISASIDDDDYFELMIRNAWHISGGDGWCGNTANKRVLVTHADGRQTVQEVENDLGVRPGDVDGYRRRLAQQGVGGGASVALFGGVNTTGGASGASGAARRPRAAQRSAHRAKGSERAGQRPCRAGVLDLQDPMAAMRDMFYDPPCSFEALAEKLKASQIDMDPSIAPPTLQQLVRARRRGMKRLAAVNFVADVAKAVGATPGAPLTIRGIYDVLAQRFGRDAKSSAPSNIVERVRAKIIERAGKAIGIRGVARALRVMDDSGDGRLSRDEIKHGLQDYGIALNMKELEQLMTYFDRDGDGSISFDEFLVGLRGDMNERRQRLVRMAFDVLDKTGDGRVTIEDIADTYDVSQHPDVVQGRLTPEDALLQFLEQFDAGEKDGIVSPDEFLDYYRSISASIDGDDYFELMIRNAWHISGGDGWCGNTANKRVLVTHADGRQTVQEVENDLGVRPGDVDGYRRRLAQQGVGGGASVALFGGVNTTGGASGASSAAKRRNQTSWAGP